MKYRRNYSETETHRSAYFIFQNKIIIHQTLYNILHRLCDHTLLGTQFLKLFKLTIKKIPQISTYEFKLNGWQEIKEERIKKLYEPFRKLLISGGREMEDP